MHLNDIYPRFTFNDAYHRLLKFEYRKGKYYREWLNPPVSMAKTYLRREITRSQYANGLLACVEYHVHGRTDYNPDVRADVKSEAEQDLDDWFGPKRGEE